MTDAGPQKRYINAQDLLEDSFQLAINIYNSGYRPRLIIGIWRGGTPVGIAVQEYFEYRGASTDHIAIRATSYTGINRQSETIQVDGLEYIAEHTGHEDPLLLVDDVFDTGRSVEAVIKALSEMTGRDCRKQIRIACPWYKPAKNRTDLAPDYHLHETGDWLVFPHELAGLTRDEIAAGKPALAQILNKGER
jgi:hypoxanthine phosphoribosyltransferase